LPFLLCFFFLLAGQRAKPATGHAPNLVEVLGDEEQLLGTDPAALGDEPPEHSQILQVEIHAA
jgi:hypothetical protein